jgi:hypothetical protein
MSEDQGFPPVPVTDWFPAEPDVTQDGTPGPGTDQDQAPDPEPAEAVTRTSGGNIDVTWAAPGLLEAVTELPPSLPFIPAEGVAAWLRDALTDYDRRLRNAGY